MRGAPHMLIWALSCAVLQIHSGACPNCMIYVHAPKTGGATAQDFLKQCPSIDFRYGHHNFRVHDLLARGNNTVVITMREPVDRLVSEFMFSVLQLGHDCGPKLSQLALSCSSPYDNTSDPGAEGMLTSAQRLIALMDRPGDPIFTSRRWGPHGSVTFSSYFSGVRLDEPRLRVVCFDRYESELRELVAHQCPAVGVGRLPHHHSTRDGPTGAISARLRSELEAMYAGDVALHKHFCVKSTL